MKNEKNNIVGFVQFKNSVLSALMKTRIPGEVRQVVDVIIFKTWGFNKEKDWISLSQFQDMTGIKKKSHISRALSKGIEMKIISKIDDNSQPLFSINEEIADWCPLEKRKKKPSEKQLQREHILPIPFDISCGQASPNMGKGIPKNGDGSIPNIGDLNIPKNGDGGIPIYGKGVSPYMVKGVSPYMGHTDNNIFTKNNLTIDIGEIEKQFISGNIKNKISAVYNLFHLICGSSLALTNPSHSRNNLVKARLNKFPDFKFWVEFFERVVASDYLTGKVNGFLPTFDWLLEIEKDQFYKIIEGAYDNRKGKKTTYTGLNNNSEYEADGATEF